RHERRLGPAAPRPAGADRRPDRGGSPAGEPGRLRHHLQAAGHDRVGVSDLNNRGFVAWIVRLNQTLPLFYKVLIANAVLIAAGALAATWALTHFHGPLAAGYTPATAVLAAAIGVSILVNYLLMRLAFHPLFNLRDTMEAVWRGELSAR